MTPLQMKMYQSQKIINRSLLALGLIIINFLWLDKPIALFVNEIISGHDSLPSSHIPDLLFPFSLSVTAFAWTAFIFLKRQVRHELAAQFFLFIGISVPISFLLKSVLKFLIGRINTKYWLLCPGSPDFHFLHGTENYCGFPSGHMAVFTVIVLALRRYFPRYRLIYNAALASLGLALIVTGYHFLSDVIAGVCAGVVVDNVAYQCIRRPLTVSDTAET